MGATQSARPKVLVYGAPHAGKKSLVKALGDDEFELFTSDDGADADAVVYVVDANQPTQWTVPIELLHSVNLRLGRTVPLCVVVNKSDVQGSAPAQQVLPQLAAAASKAVSSTPSSRRSHWKRRRVDGVGRLKFDFHTGRRSTPAPPWAAASGASSKRARSRATSASRR